MVGSWVKKALLLAGGFWLATWLLLVLNDGMWLANLVVYYALLTFALVLLIAVVGRLAERIRGRKPPYERVDRAPEEASG